MAQKTPHSPNILFLQVDQLTASALRIYGNTACQTPNLDRLADTGALFERTYCNFPLCSPSRASMATGQLCSKIGAYDNAADLPASIPTYAHYLREMGYLTALSGKMHFIGPDQYHGFEERLTADLYPADYAWVPNWQNEGKRDTNDARAVTINGVAQQTIQMEFDDLVTGKAIEFLEMQHDRPFFLQVSWTHPHEPYLCRKEFWDLYEDIHIPMPKVGQLPEKEHDAHSVRILKDFGMLDYDFKVEDIRNARRAYYGSISYIDQMIGDILKVLEEQGLSQNTAIVFTSDHGEMLGERGIWFKKHFFEDALRVPLLISAPWIEPQRVSTLTSLVDLLPTFCGLATGSGWEGQIEPLDGIDLTTLLGSGKDQPDRSIYAEYLAEATPSPIFMIRQGDFKYIWSENDPTQMYNIPDDPLELINLSGRIDYTEIENDFRTRIDKLWDHDQLCRDITLSQRRRRLIQDAHFKGCSVRWNHDEAPDSAVPWYRGQGGYNDWAFAFVPEPEDP